MPFVRDPSRVAARPSMLAARTLTLALVVAGCSEPTSSLFDPGGRFFGDPPPRDIDASVSRPLDPVVTLGQALFFDPELSGNRDISCGSCHVPFLSTAEGGPLAMGHGAIGVGPHRTVGDGAIIPRHTLDLFHRSRMDVLFWDGRVETLSTGEVIGPVPTPPGITTAFELASILPLLDRHEMRGDAGDRSLDGRDNELAAIPDGEAFQIWEAIVRRLREVPAYPGLFLDAFGDDEIRIDRVAIALTTFQDDFWGPLETIPVDPVITPELELGQTLFFGDAGCARCHSGDLFTDERFHDLAVPQFGPGFEDAGGLDEGRFRVTGLLADRFAFRTPPLRNVALTPPYMHNGAYDSLEDAVRHHFDPVASLHAYTGEGDLFPSLAATLVTDPATLDAIAANVADAAPLRSLTDDEVDAIVTFLESLTNPMELTRIPEDAVPSFVPSGLPIDAWIPGVPHPFRERLTIPVLGFTEPDAGVGR